MGSVTFINSQISIIVSTVLYFKLKNEDLSLRRNSRGVRMNILTNYPTHYLTQLSNIQYRIII